MRVYGGGGVVLRSTNRLERPFVQGGVELRPGGRIGSFEVLAAMNYSSYAIQDWGPTWSAMAGVEWSQPQTLRRFRFLLAYLDGFTPFGQFFETEKLRSFGVEGQFLF